MSYLSLDFFAKFCFIGNEPLPMTIDNYMASFDHNLVLYPPPSEHHFVHTTLEEAPRNWEIVSVSQRLTSQTISIIDSYNLNTSLVIIPAYADTVEPTQVLWVRLDQPKQQSWEQMSADLYQTYKPYMPGPFFVELQSTVGERVDIVPITKTIKQQFTDLVEPRIRTMVEECDLKGYTMFNLKEEQSDDDLATPTIMVFARPESYRSDWAEVTNRFHEILQDLGLDSTYALKLQAMRRHLCQATWNRSTVDDLMAMNDPLKLANASSIGLEDDKSSATCGGFVRVRLTEMDGAKQVYECFVTNHHVVASDGSASPVSWASDPNTSTRRRIRLCFPSGEDLQEALKDVEFTKQSLEKEIEKFEAWNKDLKLSPTPKQEDAKKRLCDLQNVRTLCQTKFPVHVGEVLVTSGLQSSVDGNSLADEERVSSPSPLLDWALVKRADDCFSGNYAPDHVNQPARVLRTVNFDPKSSAFVTRAGVPLCATEAGELSDEETVIMESRSDSPTFGRVNAVDLMKRSRTHGGVPFWSVEVQVYGIGQSKEKFGQPGSSGAFIFNNANQICGLFNGVADIKNKSVGLVTPMKDVLSDMKAKIEAQTGAKVEIYFPDGDETDVLGAV